MARLPNENRETQQFPEVVVSTNAITDNVQAAIRRGVLRKIGPRLYTPNLKDNPEAIISRNRWQIVGAYCAGGVVADRTALEGKPAKDGSVFVVAERARDVDLPGLKIRPRPGKGPIEGDRPFVAGLYFASQARAFLENLRPSRARSRVARTLPRATIEELLERELVHNGDARLNQVRDLARRISPELGLDSEFATLDQIIGALLGTKDAKMKSPVAAARARGEPYDARRIELFQNLHSELVSQSPVIRPAPQMSPQALANLAFFEAYFSNFIEGTEFSVEEAREIVFEHVVPRERPEDAHDIMGTFNVVSSVNDMSQTSRSVEEMLALLKRRHANIMDGRPDKRPGSFKDRPNRAGGLLFVAPDQVEGTLARGFEFYRSLEAPFARAAFMMFMIAEVHPFVDGNGRTARIMMNAELVSAGEIRIIIPTVCRNNYLAALRALSHNGVANPIIRMLDFAQRYTGMIPFDSYEEANNVLTRTNAFMDSNEADNAGKRLVLPSPDIVAGT